MRSNRIALVFPAFLLMVGCGVIGARPPDGNDEPDAGVGPSRELPEVSLFAGAETLAVSQPVRCADVDASKDPIFAYGRSAGQPGSGEARAFAGIFKDPPVAGDSIRNPEAMVWWWSSGWSRTSGHGHDGALRFSDGRGAGPNGELDESREPSASILQAGHWYWFATWAWDDSRQLRFASEARAFCVGGGCDCHAKTSTGTEVGESFCLAVPGTPPTPAESCGL